MTVTRSESHFQGTASTAPVPGALVVFSRHTPLYRLVSLPEGRSVVLGREDVGGNPVPDDKCSREHAELGFANGRFTLTDRDSRNGTFLDGVPVKGTVTAGDGAVLRLAHTVLLLTADLRPYLTGHVAAGEFVIGPTLQQVLDWVVVARHRDSHLLVLGETGAGKELIARRFSEAGERRGPFVTVNCATVHAATAEQQLFGAVKGAYTDARSDHDGFFLKANGGVIFLDEIAELDLSVQAKLLRTLQNGEVQRLGENAPRKVEVCVVAASHQDLQLAVDRGAFREDLYFRLFASQLTVPPLRERREELPWLMQGPVEREGLTLHATVVEAALLRPWPGNVRELVAQMVRAADAARRSTSSAVRAEHLEPQAGQRKATPVAPPAPAAPAPRPKALTGRAEAFTREQLEEALRTAGSIAAAARALSLHRTQLYRVLRSHGLVKADAVDEAADEP
jgi:transcriptional regulator with GAF, ATPase, and Fis domain